MADITQKGSLPDGWIVQISINHPDRVYYFNVNTGASTWECPKLHPPETNRHKQSRSLSVLNKQASNKNAAVHPESKSPELFLQHSKIVEFLSDAKRESQKRSAENETPSGPLLQNKLSTPPTAIVAPLDKNPVTKKKRKKRPKKKNPAAATVAVHSPSDTPSATVLQRNDSDGTSKKVSFSIKSKNKIPTSRSEKEILSKSKNFTPVFKKKQSLVISVPTAKKPSGASIDREIRCVTLDKNKVKSKEPLKRSPDQRFSPPQFRNDNKLTGCKVEKQCKLPSQNQPNESNKRRSNVLNANSGGVPSASKSKFLHESEGEVSDMDCEMNPEFEELTVTVSTAGVNAGASTSRSSDQDSFDIEMLDMSSSDLVKIDDIFISGFEGSLLKNYFIVVDTNVFISELKDIDEMKDTPVNGHGPPHFIIPWVVFQELDNLKRNGGRPKPGTTKESNMRKSYDLKKSSGEAIRYLNTLLKAKHPRFHFQRPDEVQNCRKDFSRNNDDQLLECCMKIQERMPKENVILLTNDKNLANKSMVLNIVVHDINSLLEFLKPNAVLPEVVTTTYIPEPFKVLREQQSLEHLHQTNYKKCELEIHTHLSTAREILKDVLDPLFEREMDEAYGDAWHFFPVERHKLNGILKGILRYWRTVFTFFFSGGDKVKFETLQEKSSRPEGFLGERAECLQIFEIIDDLFVIIKRKWPTIHVPIAQLRKVKALTEEAFCNLSECEKSMNTVENAIKQAEISCCIEVFNHNWTIINHICGCTSDFCGIPHKLVYDKSAPVPPITEFQRIVPKLHASLGQLKDNMEKMLLVVKASKPNGAIFKELRKLLTELIPNLRIQADSINISQFSTKMVEKFCRLPENRSRVEEGYKQLLNYYEILGKCLPFVNGNTLF